MPIDCLAGFGLTFDNSLTDEAIAIYCAGQNIEETSGVDIGGDTVVSKLQYPYRNRLGEQVITGRLDFGDTRPDMELQKLFATASQLIVELTGGPLPTAVVPAADEMMRITVERTVPTSGTAEPLVREGVLTSSYEFGGFLNPASEDIKVEFVGEDAIAFPVLGP